MRPTQDLEKLIKRLHYKAGSDLHKRTISDALQAQAKSASARQNILKSPGIKIAFAALIILAIGFLMTRPGPGEKAKTTDVTTATKSPANMQTILSLNIAYRRGGIEAVDKQCKKAMEMLGPRPTKITIKEILTEFNGT